MDEIDRAIVNRLQGGFPLGEYSVEVFLDGVSSGTRTFKVEQR